MQRPYLNGKLLIFFVFVKKEVNRKTAIDIGVEGHLQSASGKGFLA